MGFAADQGAFQASSIEGSIPSWLTAQAEQVRLEWVRASHY